MEECAASKVKRVVFASSNHTQHGACIGDLNSCETLDRSKVTEPLKLTDVAIPDTFYAVSKLFGEDLGKLFALQHDIEFVAMRIGWVWESGNCTKNTLN